MFWSVEALIDSFLVSISHQCLTYIHDEKILQLREKMTGIKVNVSSKSTRSVISKAKYLSAFSGFSLFSTDDKTKT